MTTQVKSWGNSQGIRLTKDVLESVGIKVNDILDVRIVGNEIVISKKFRHRTLEERAEAFGGKIDHCEEFDWGEPRGREVW